MSYEPELVTEYLLDSTATPWTLAPKALLEAKANHDSARVAEAKAKIAAQQAELALASAAAAWDTEGRQNARAGKPLPSTDAKSLAAFNLANAKEDVEAAVHVKGLAAGVISDLMKDESLRNEWANTLSTAAAKRQGELKKLIPNVINTVADITAYLGHIPILADWTNNLNPNYPSDGGATAGLEMLVSLKPFQKYVPQLLNAPAAQVVEPAPSETFYYTAKNGNVVEVQTDGKYQAETNGLRLSSAAEIEAYELANNAS
jgi:hypothetical protein